MPIGSNILAGSSGQATGYDIEQSLRFEDGDSAKVERTPSSAGSLTTWTFSAWVKRGNFGSTQHILGTYVNALYIGEVVWHASDNQFQWEEYNGGTIGKLRTNARYRDPSAWYHIVCRWDTTNSTAGNRMRLYINGVEETSFEIDTNPSSGAFSTMNTANATALGVRPDGSGYLDGYLAEVHFIDGQALGPESFGETNSATNQWVPIDAKDDLTYGTNGFYLPFSATELANSFTDSAERSVLTVTANGNAHTDTTVKKIGTASLQLDGTGDYLSLPDNAFVIGTGDFTMEAWIKFDGAPTQAHSAFFNAGTGDGTAGAHWVLYYYTSAGAYWGWSDDGTASSEWTSNWTYDSNWHHIAVCRQSGTYRFYLDGSQQTSSTSGGSQDLSAATTNFRVGSGYGDFGGYMDEVRYSDTCRYPDGTSFTPYTSALTADVNTKLLLHCDGSDGGTTFTDSSWTGTPRHTITANGDVANTRTTFNKIETFTADGSFTIPAGGVTADILIVGGGGGGGGDGNGNYAGGGGGAGGLLYGTGISLNAGTYSVTVGGGGAGGGPDYNGTNGSNSVITETTWGTATAVGGGGGGRRYAGGLNGGSGGGGGSNVGIGGGAAGSATQGNSNGLTGYGNDGGTGVQTGNNMSGSGGGAGGAGSTSSTGGSGKAYDISGSSVTYATGGGGAVYQNGNGAAGAANTGDGGKAGGGNSSGGAGGSGIVIVSYPDPDHPIDGSSINFDGTGDYLSIADSDDFDFSSAFTIEGWWRFDSSATQTLYVKRGSNIADNIKLGVNISAGKWALYISSNGSSWDIVSDDSISSVSTNTWYHVALTWSGTEYNLWIDGTAVKTVTSSSAPNVNTASLYFGCEEDGSSNPVNGYADEIRISDTARYTSSFTPSTTAFTADSNTLLLIHSDFDGGIGADSSGNTNDFTPVNLVATDVMTGESPTNNFATLNPLINSSGSPAYSEGNLVITPDGSNYSVYQSTISVSSGKWYAEYLVGDTNTFCGVSSADQSASAYGSYWDNTSADFIFFNNNNGNKIIDGSATSYVGSGATVGQIVGVAIDLDSSAINFYINNSAQGSISFSGGVASASSFVFSGVGYAADAERWNFGADSSFAGAKTAQGNGGDGEDFYYTPPAGFKALNSDNLSDPSIADPTKHFNTVLWTGDDASSRTITGVGFDPGLSWVKSRDTTSTGNTDHHVSDIVRGANKNIVTNFTGAEYNPATDTSHGGLGEVTTDGFTLISGTSDSNSVNESGKSYVGWSWKAGGTAVSNTDGTDITSSVSANPTAGMSVVKWTGTGATDDSVGHGLSQTPELIIVKNIEDAGNDWATWHDSFPVQSVVYLNSTGAAALGGESGRFDTLPTASVFTPGSAANTNENTKDYIAYCFHSVDGYSKVGTYESNNVSDGPFIYTGFSPAFMLFKNIDGTEAWSMFDTARNTINGPDAKLLMPSATSAESSTANRDIDFLSNGFKIRASALNPNTGANTYIFLAMASSPFKTSNAR